MKPYTVRNYRRAENKERILKKSEVNEIHELKKDRN